MTLDLNSVLLLIIIFQFLLMGIFLLTNKKGKRLSNLLLGIFCMTISLSLTEMFITMNGYHNWVGLFAFMDLVVMLVYGPLMFLYTKSIIYRDFHFEWKQLLHFLPFLLWSILVSINYAVTPEEAKMAALQKIYSHQLSMSQAMFVVPFYLHILIYVILAFRQIRIYDRVISEDFSDLKPYSLKWLNFLLRSFLAITLISLMLSIFPYTQLRALTIYALAADIILTFYIINQILFKALRQPELFSGIEEPRKYVKSSLTDQDKVTGLEKIQELMTEEKPFLDPNLSLKNLSESLEMREREVSQIINEKMKLSFHDYINKQRVEHAKNAMKHTTDPKVTILEILYESGFNSKSSFNTAFKKHSSVTPTEFRDSIVRKE